MSVWRTTLVRCTDVSVRSTDGLVRRSDVPGAVGQPTSAVPSRTVRDSGQRGIGLWGGLSITPAITPLVHNPFRT